MEEHQETMTYHFGAASLKRMVGVDPGIIKVATRVLDFMDITVQDGGGIRDAELQAVLFAEGKSKKDGVTKLSRHQIEHPDARDGNGDACDFAPYPIKWDDPRRWYYMGGLFLALGAEMGIPFRWGGDWDSDGEITDQKFHDLGHIERVR